MVEDVGVDDTLLGSDGRASQLKTDSTSRTTHLRGAKQIDE